MNVSKGAFVFSMAWILRIPPDVVVLESHHYWTSYSIGIWPEQTLPVCGLLYFVTLWMAGLLVCRFEKSYSSCCCCWHCLLVMRSELPSRLFCSRMIDSFLLTGSTCFMIADVLQMWIVCIYIIYIRKTDNMFCVFFPLLQINEKTKQWPSVQEEKNNNNNRYRAFFLRSLLFLFFVGPANRDHSQWSFFEGPVVSLLWTSLL